MVKNLPVMEETPQEGNGHPAQYSCLENFMDRGAWWAAVHGVTKTERFTEVVVESLSRV